jgi:hypothetical protein
VGTEKSPAWPYCNIFLLLKLKCLDIRDVLYNKESLTQATISVSVHFALLDVFVWFLDAGSNTQVALLLPGLNYVMIITRLCSLM